MKQITQIFVEGESSTLNENLKNKINCYNKHILEANRLMVKLLREVFNLFVIHKIS